VQVLDEAPLEHHDPLTLRHGLRVRGDDLKRPSDIVGEREKITSKGITSDVNEGKIVVAREAASNEKM
jgi:hypothetical protein